MCVKLSDGRILKIPKSTDREYVVSPPKPDHVNNCAHLVLELGMIYAYFLELCHTPDRCKLLGLLKMMMVVMKSNNSRAKYPLEILRLMVQQYSLLSQNIACMVLQSWFVNTSGKQKGYKPADLQMEHIVRIQKKHLHHMHSRKTVPNIHNRSSALAGMNDISNVFDRETEVARTGTHTAKEADIDELSIMDDLHDLKPFNIIPGRKHNHFQGVPKSLLNMLDGAKFAQWFKNHKSSFKP